MITSSFNPYDRVSYVAIDDSESHIPKLLFETEPAIMLKMRKSYQPQPVAQPVAVVKCCITVIYVLYHSIRSFIFATCYICNEIKSFYMQAHSITGRLAKVSLVYSF